MEGAGIVREFGMGMYTLLYFKWITRIPYPMELCSILHGSLDRRGIWGRIYTCVCVAESLCCSPETITTLFVNWLYPNTK